MTQWRSLPSILSSADSIPPTTSLLDTATAATAPQGKQGDEDDCNNDNDDDCYPDAVREMFPAVRGDGGLRGRWQCGCWAER